MKIHCAFLVVASIVSTATLLAGPITDPSVFWTDTRQDSIRRARIDGTGITTVASGYTSSVDIEYNQLEDMLYWIDNNANGIFRANRDGSNISRIITTPQPLKIAIDSVGGKIYWTDNIADKIQRSNLDGSNIEELYSAPSQLFAMALNVAGGKMYWSEYSTIKSANLDGSNVQTLTNGSGSRVHSIDIDPIDGKMYWVTFLGENVQRANLDGSSRETLISLPSTTGPTDIELDLINRKMYYSLQITGQLQRANFDGSELEDVISDPNSGFAGLALYIPEPASASFILLFVCILCGSRQRRSRFAPLTSPPPPC